MKLTEKQYAILERAAKGHSHPGHLPLCRTLAKHGLLRVYEEHSRQGAHRVIAWSAVISADGRRAYNEERLRRTGPSPLVVAVRELLAAALDVANDHSDSLVVLREEEGDEVAEDSKELNTKLREIIKKVESLLKGAPA